LELPQTQNTSFTHLKPQACLFFSWPSCNHAPPAPQHYTNTTTTKQQPHFYQPLIREAGTTSARFNRFATSQAGISPPPEGKTASKKDTGKKVKRIPLFSCFTKN